MQSFCVPWLGWLQLQELSGRSPPALQIWTKTASEGGLSPQGPMSVQWGQGLNVTANFCQPPWRRAHLSLDLRFCCPVCSESLLSAKARGTMLRDPLCMLGLSRLIRCSLQPLFCLVNSELLPLTLLGLPLFPEGVFPAAKLAVAREGWGRNFPLHKNKVVCDLGEERAVKGLLGRRPESEIQPAYKGLRSALLLNETPGPALFGCIIWCTISGGKQALLLPF